MPVDETMKQYPPDIIWIKPIKRNALHKQVEKSLATIIDVCTLEIYDWVDLTLMKAGFKIPGDHPKKARILGKQIESSLYKSLMDKVTICLNTISATDTQTEVLNKVLDTITKWQIATIGTMTSSFEELLHRGIIAGQIDSGVKVAFDLVDENAIEILRQDPKRIGSRIKIFSNDIIEKFRDIIANSYGPEGEFSLSPMVKKMSEVVDTQRYKLERIVRTETSSVSNLGRLWAWNQDPDKYFYEYHWNAMPDNRVKYISLWRMKNGPYTFDEIAFLWENQEQDFTDLGIINDVFNQRCAVSRFPRNEAFKGNKFKGASGFNITTPLGFKYE